MYFFIITAGIIFSASFLISRLSKALGINISLEATILCGILAVASNFSALTISSYLTTQHFILLGGLIIFSAIIATFYNARVLGANQLPNTTLEIATTEIATTPKTNRLKERVSSIFSKKKTTLSNAKKKIFKVFTLNNTSPDQSENIPNNRLEMLNNINEAALMKEKTIVYEMTNAKTIVLEKNKPPISSVEDTIHKAEDKPIADVTLSKEDMPLENGSLKTEASSTENQETKSKIIAESSENPSLETNNDNIAITEASIVEAKISDTPTNKASEKLDNELIRKVELLTSLDELLDYAYEQKSTNNTSNALYAYNVALHRYSDDSYAPFIAIDMINICKAIGDYGAAIASYNKAMALPSVAENKHTMEEFKAGLRYVTAVNQILNSHNIENTPLNHIPANIMEEIEVLFSKQN